MATQIQLRRGTAAEWTASNPTLAEGEMGIELDSGNFKIGNGLDQWDDLAYGFIALPAGGTEGQILIKDSDSDYDFDWVDNSAESTYFLVRNETGSTIPKGTLLAAVDAETSGRIDVAPFEVTGLENSELRVIGLATETMLNNSNGTAITFGQLKNLDTRGNVATSIAVGDETWAQGDILYAHPTVDGKLTNVKPQHDLAVAFITVLSPSIGVLAVRVSPGNNHLEWMHDVEIDEPADNEVLTYESATNLWKNKPLPVTSVSDLSDVDLTGLDDDYILRYDAATETWKVEVLPAGVQDLDDLTDVDLTVSPTDGQVLTYNDATSQWKAASLPTDVVGATELDELDDVDLTVAPVEDDVLTYNGTSWVAAAPTGGGTGYPTITTATKTTASIATGVNELNTVTMEQGYRLLKIETDVAARVRLYTTTTGRDADETRSFLTEPDANNGVLFDYITSSGDLSNDLSPTVDGFVATGTAIPITVTNLSGSTGAVTVTLTYVRTI